MSATSRTTGELALAATATAMKQVKTAWCHLQKRGSITSEKKVLSIHFSAIT